MRAIRIAGFQLQPGKIWQVVDLREPDLVDHQDLIGAQYVRKCLDRRQVQLTDVEALVARNRLMRLDRAIAAIRFQEARHRGIGAREARAAKLREIDRKSTRLNSRHYCAYSMTSSA